MPRTLTVIPDTNVFIHCHPLESISWSDIADCSEVRIVLVNTVHGELDDLKRGGNDRRAKRARRIRPILTEMVRMNTNTKIIRDKNPKITLEVAIEPGHTIDRPAQLIPGKPDDDVMYDALCYLNAHPEHEGSFLSHDTSCLMRARAIGIKSDLVPDAWLLPPENDPRDKEIVILKDQIKRLTDRYPQISVSLMHADASTVLDVAGNPCELNNGNIDTGIEVTITEYPDISPQALHDIVDFAQKVHALADSFKDAPSTREEMMLASSTLLNNMWSWKSPSADEISRYRDTDYPNWLNSIRSWAGSLGENLRQFHHGYPLLLALKNIGNVPAESLVIELQLTEGLVFNPPRRNRDNYTHTKELRVTPPPAPPKPPEGRFVNRLERAGIWGHSIIESIAADFATPIVGTRPVSDMLLNRPPPKDPHGFYWKPHRPSMSTNKWALSCETFRHEVDTYELMPTILEVGKANAVDKGVLKIQVTANNLPIPITRIVVLRIQHQVANTFEIAQKMIRDRAWNPEQYQE